MFAIMIGVYPRSRIRYATRTQTCKSRRAFGLDGMPPNVLETISQQLLTVTSGDQGLTDALALANSMTEPTDSAAILHMPKHARFADQRQMLEVLPLLTGLESLDIDPVCRAGLGMLRTAARLSRSRTLRKLVVRHIMHLGSAPRQLAKSMAACMPALTDLEVHFHQRMMPASTPTAAAAGVTVPAMGDEEIAALMKACPGLKRLVVSGATVRKAEPLASALGAMQGLETLSVPGALVLTSNDVCEQLIGALGRSRHSETLRRLDLSRCDVDSASLRAIAGMLPGLVELDVSGIRGHSGRRLDDGAIFEAGRRLTRLTTLRLGSALASVDRLPQALAPLTGLVELDVSRCSMRARDVAPLVKALPALRILDLSWSQPNVPSFVTISQQCAMDLGLSSRLFGEERGASWAPALQQIKRLDLTSTMIDDAVAHVLVQHLWHLKQLRVGSALASAAKILKQGMPASCELAMD